MASRTPLNFPRFRALDSNGDPLSGGKVYFYEAGTTTAKTTWSDPDLTVANTQPVVLDSAGEADIYLNETAYKIVLKDANDVTQWTVDNYVVDITTFLGKSVPPKATDSGTDAYEAALGVDAADGDVVMVDIQSANTTTTPTLENTTGTPSGAKTITTRDGSALYAGALEGVHRLQYDSTADAWLALDPFGTVTGTQWSWLNGLSSAPLEDNDLAENGGSLPEVDRTNTFTEGQEISTTSSSNPAYLVLKNPNFGGFCSVRFGSENTNANEFRTGELTAFTADTIAGSERGELRSRAALGGILTDEVVIGDGIRGEPGMTAPGTGNCNFKKIFINGSELSGGAASVENNEYSQIANIDANTISTTQWSWLGGLSAQPVEETRSLIGGDGIQSIGDLSADRTVAVDGTVLRDSDKTGSDAGVVSGTAGTNGNVVQWNVDGDAVDGGVATSNIVTPSSTDTFTNKTFDANGTGNTLSNVETGDFAASAKTGLDTQVVTGTSGTSGNVSEWNADGDLVDSGIGSSTILVDSDLAANGGSVTQDNVSETISQNWTFSGGVEPISLKRDGALNLSFESYRDDGNEHAIVRGQAARGTASSPAQLQSGDIMFSLDVRAWNGSSFPFARYHNLNAVWDGSEAGWVVGITTGGSQGAGTLNGELYDDASRVLAEDQLAANGGTVPETDRSNTFNSNQQIHKNDGSRAEFFGRGDGVEADGLTEFILWAQSKHTTTDARITGVVSELFGSTAGDRGGRLTLNTKSDGGSLSDRLLIDEQGIHTPNATGGGQGDGTLNAVELYDGGNRVYSASNAPSVSDLSDSGTVTSKAQQTLTFGSTLDTTGFFVIANGTADTAQAASGTTTKAGVVAGTINRMTFFHNGDLSTNNATIKIHVNGASQASLTASAGADSVDTFTGIGVSVSDGDIVEVEFYAGLTNAGASMIHVMVE